MVRSDQSARAESGLRGDDGASGHPTATSCRHGLVGRPSCGPASATHRRARSSATAAAARRRRPPPRRPCRRRRRRRRAGGVRGRRRRPSAPPSSMQVHVARRPRSSCGSASPPATSPGTTTSAPARRSSPPRACRPWRSAAQILVSQTSSACWPATGPATRYELPRTARRWRALPESTQTYAVGWAAVGDDPPTSAGTAATAAARARRPRRPTPFVGRVGRARRRWSGHGELARAGAGQIVLVGGEAGCRQDPAGHRVRPARPPMPVPPCSSAAATTTSPSRTSHGSRRVDELLPTLPRRHAHRRPGPAPGTAGPAARSTATASDRRCRRRRWIPTPTRYRLYEAFVERAREAAAPAGRRCVVLDDLHWAGRADPRSAPSRRPVRRCPPGCSSWARSATRATRSPSRSPAVSPTCAASTRVRRLRLEGLDEAAVERFVTDGDRPSARRSTSRTSPPSWRRAAAGTPSTSWSCGATSSAPGRSRAPATAGSSSTAAAASTVPDSVREVVAARLARLSPPARRNDRARRRRRAARRPRGPGASPRGRRRRSSTPPSASWWRPGCWPSVALDGTGLPVRALPRTRHRRGGDRRRLGARRAHLAVARRHRGRCTRPIVGPVLAELARHFAAAAPLAPIDKAVYYGRRAAAQAVRTAAYDEAASHLEAVLALDPPDLGSGRTCSSSWRTVLLPTGHYAAESRAQPTRRSRWPPRSAPPTSPPRRRCCSSWRTHFPGLPGGPAVELLRRGASTSIGDERRRRCRCACRRRSDGRWRSTGDVDLAADVIDGRRRPGAADRRPRAPSSSAWRP